LVLLANVASKDGYDVEIWDYGDGKLVMRISNSVVELWNITGFPPKGTEEEEAEGPFTPEEEAMRLRFLGGMQHIEERVADVLAEDFKFDGVEKTLGVTIGERAILPMSKMRIMDGLSLEFVRISIKNRSGSAMGTQKQIETGLGEDEGVFRQPSIRPIRQVISKEPSAPKEPLGLGKQNLMYLRRWFGLIMDGLGIKSDSPRVKLEGFLTLEDRKYLATPRNAAMHDAIKDLVEWIKKRVRFRF